MADAFDSHSTNHLPKYERARYVLRHSFAATAAEMGFSELTIAGLLGHSVPGVTARYAHVPDSALVAAADQVATKAGHSSARLVPTP